MIDVISTKEKQRLAAKLKRIRERNVALDADLMNQVASIAENVRARGDAALIDYAQRFEGCVMQPSDLRLVKASCEKRRSA